MEDRPLKKDGEIGGAESTTRGIASLKKVVIGLGVVMVIVIVLNIALLLHHQPRGNTSPSAIGCTHPIYCKGELLRAVELGAVFSDSKTFVDMPMKYPPAQIMAAYAALPNGSNLTQFVLDHFYPAGSEVVPYNPPDYVLSPPFLANILDDKLQTFGRNVNSKWQHLLRTFNFTGLCSECYSSLPLPHPFVVPGGRFREFYYWDSFWILQGLLVSGMNRTSMHVVQNLLHLVDTYGFMPNGARCYYLDRSQPPVLTQMVSLLYNHSNLVSSTSIPSQTTPNTSTTVYLNDTFLDDVLPVLMKEYHFWMDTPHKVPGVALNRYYVHTDMPRPESYREDYITSQQIPQRDPTDLYSNIAAGAETGWDFSTRWFEGNRQNMTGIRTKNVIPVDLNAILLRNEQLLADLYATNGNAHALVLRAEAHAREAAMWSMMWNSTTCSFHDLIVESWNADGSIKSYRQQTKWYISTFTALWVPSLNSRVSALGNCTVQSLSNPASGQMPTHIDIGGVPTSLEQSGQQWDFPNSWAPTQWFTIRSLQQFARSGDTNARAAHRALVQRWVTSGYCGYQQKQMMFEKYSAVAIGDAGHGGEYIVQDGFGWTNGVMLELLRDHGDWLQAPTSC